MRSRKHVSNGVFKSISLCPKALIIHSLPLETAWGQTHRVMSHQ